MSIFVSHSRKDVELVRLVKNSLPLIGNEFTAIVYEDLPDSPAKGQDAKNIKKLIADCRLVILFCTENAHSSEFTKAWIQYEASQASAHNKPLVVFQVEEQPPKMPITYFTDVAVVNLAKPELVAKIQTVAKSHGFAKVTEHPVSRTAAFAAGGAVFGPVGMAVAGLIGLATTPKSRLSNVPSIVCPNCKSQYRFWGQQGTGFHCPSCLTSLKMG